MKIKDYKISINIELTTFVFSIEGILTRLINTLQHQLLSLISCALEHSAPHPLYIYKSHPDISITQLYITVLYLNYKVNVIYLLYCIFSRKLVYNSLLYGSLSDKWQR